MPAVISSNKRIARKIAYWKQWKRDYKMQHTDDNQQSYCWKKNSVFSECSNTACESNDEGNGSSNNQNECWI